MVRIRLRRVGAKKQPSYRVVVADQHKARDGRFIEIIGNYNPRTEPITMVIKGDRARYWLSQGAQPSDAVRRLLVKLAILDEQGKILEPAPEPLEQVVAEVAEPAAEVVEEAPVTEEEAEAEADEEEAAAEEPEAEEEAEAEESDEA